MDANEMYPSRQDPEYRESVYDHLLQWMNPAIMLSLDDAGREAAIDAEISRREVANLQREYRFARDPEEKRALLQRIRTVLRYDGPDPAA